MKASDAWFHYGDRESIGLYRTKTGALEIKFDGPGYRVEFLLLDTVAAELAERIINTLGATVVLTVADRKYKV